MTTTATSVARLLDVAATAESESLRAGALRRLKALRLDETERRRAAVPPETLAAARAGSIVASRSAAVAPALARFASSVAVNGVSARDGRVPDPRATSLARTLLAATPRAFERTVEGLGRAHATYLCRDLDAPSAGRFLRRLGGEGAKLPRYARLVPPKDDATLRAACRRLASTCAPSDEGAALVQGLGRALLCGLLAGADAAYAAALCRRASIAHEEHHTFEAAWVAAARAIAAHEVETCRG